ncbi:hypothetical protein mvi_08480 [Methylobacterium indicum]|uniref:Uncharacterized protein n=1 Tax=Methylobacterium indicum TaxID=1775910 RepID=A0A8H8WQC4_9HYPH|nr:hypothetical protein mvi_08480 [Methylobacterium indicum]
MRAFAEDAVWTGIAESRAMRALNSSVEGLWAEPVMNILATAGPPVAEMRTRPGALCPRSVPLDRFRDHAGRMFRRRRLVFQATKIKKIQPRIDSLIMNDVMIIDKAKLFLSRAAPIHGASDRAGPLPVAQRGLRPQRRRGSAGRKARSTAAVALA